MWNVPVVVDGFDSPVNYPNICPLSPQKGKAFCQHHCDDASKGGIPTGLREFLQFCGVKGIKSKAGNFCVNYVKLKHSVILRKIIHDHIHRPFM